MLIKIKKRQNNKNNFFVLAKTKVIPKLQNLSRALVFPIAILPLAGILFGIGQGFAVASAQYNWGSGALNTFTVMSTIGHVIFNSLGIIFAGSIAFGFSKHSKGVAAISGVVAYLGMSVTISALFLPYNTDNGMAVLFDPWKLCGSDHLVTTGTQKGMLQTFMGIAPTMDLSIASGIFVGWLTCLVHNKTYQIKMPQALAFFSGEKFVPIASFLMGVAVGILGFFVFPAILLMFYYIGIGLGNGMNIGSKETYSSVGGVFIAYVMGALEQFLIPFGLHNCYYTHFWYTSAGGQMLVPDAINNGVVESFKTISGSYNIFFEQMGFIGQQFTLSPQAYQQLSDTNSNWLSLCWQDGDTWKIAFNHYTTEVGTGFTSGRFGVYDYGLPAAGLAMILTTKKENRKQVAGLVGSAIITCFTTGIIEPLIFLFVFVSPILYGIHVLIGGLSYLLAFVLNVQVGVGFTAGFIDYIFFGLFPAYSSGVNVIGDATHGTLSLWAGRNGALFVPIYGILLLIPLYFFGFYFAIKKFNIKTLGREEKIEGGDTSLVETAVQVKKNKKSNQDKDQTESIIDGLGGINNILSVNNCASRLRVEVSDITKIDKDILMTTGAYGTKVNGNHIQVIYGGKVASIKPKVEEYWKAQTQAKVTNLKEKHKSENL